MKTVKQIIYSVYQANKEDNADNLFNKVKLHLSAEHPELNFDTFEKELNKIKYLEGLIEVDKTWMFGTELEFGGHSNRLAYDKENKDELIETIKNDCSVAGDGTEYNLKPIAFKDLDKKRVALESLCFRMANKNCTLSATAGEHFHYSWKNIKPVMGAIVRSFMDSVSSRTIQYNSQEEKDTDDFYLDFGHSDQYSRYYEPKIKLMNDSYSDRRTRRNKPENVYTLKDDKSNQKEYDKSVAVYKLLQALYSTSNRSGNESYGLAGDGTRGYTRHKTIELRCWRTTHDYRSIIARAMIGRFFLTEMLRYGIMEAYEYLDYADENIWDKLVKNPYILDCYRYLAFHYNNKHKVGLSLDDLEVLTKTGHGYATAIKMRTAMIQKSLIKTNSESKAKELLKNI